MSRTTEDVDSKSGDVEHHQGHQEVVRGAEDLTGDGEARGRVEVICDWSLCWYLVDHKTNTPRHLSGGFNLQCRLDRPN